MPTKNRQIDRNSQPYCGVNAIAPVAMEKFSTVRIITLRRPIRSAIQPQNSEPNGAPMPDESNIAPDWP